MCKSTPKPKRDFAKVYPPHVDAYKITWEENDYIDFTTFCEWLRDHAMEWGTHGIGATVLRTGSPPMFGDEYVLCIGSWGHTKFALVGTDDSERDKQHIVEWNWPDEWDVT